jgi:hypothetical protein
VRSIISIFPTLLIIFKAGPITALPCRIIHVPGKEVAELNVDVAVLNKNLKLLRKIPPDVKRENREYILCNDESLANLSLFDKDDFEFTSPVYGAAKIQKTVSYYYLYSSERKLSLFTIAGIY